jgi:hypothetical protein
MYINISTRSGNGVITYTGVSSNIPITPDKYKDFTTDRVGASTVAVSNTVGVFGNLLIKYLKGLGDVYSIWIGFLDKSLSGNNQKDQLAFLPIQNFLAQFPNLYSLYINERAGENDNIQTGMIGDFALIPNSLERVLIDSLDVKHNFQSDGVYINFSNFSKQSKLKFFRNNYNNPNLKIFGDVGKLPTSCQLLYLQKASAGSSITYTAGKIWASAFDTLSIPLSLTTAELDALLADMDGSILTKTGAGVISVLGDRSSASDAFVASLQSKGFTVNINSLQSFITDAVITDGTQISALNYLESNLKSAGLLDKMVAIYPFIGANENSHKRNLLNSKDNNTAFRLIFNTATHSVNGITCNYADTKFNSTNAIADNISVGVYSRTNTANTGTDIAASIGSANNRFILYARYTGDSAVFDCYNASNERIVFSNSDSRGLFVLTRTSNNVLKAYKNGILLGSNTNTRTNMFSGNIFISGFPGATYSYTSRNYAFAFIGRGLSDADVSNLQTIIQQYQTILGRAI